jgi:hypothetical protein
VNAAPGRLDLLSLNCYTANGIADIGEPGCRGDDRGRFRNTHYQQLYQLRPG